MSQLEVKLLMLLILVDNIAMHTFIYIHINHKTGCTNNHEYYKTL